MLEYDKLHDDDEWMVTAKIGSGVK